MCDRTNSHFSKYPVSFKWVFGFCRIPFILWFILAFLQTIYEEARSLILLEGIDEFFPADQPDVIYKSRCLSVSSYRRFLNKQPKFKEHALFLKKYGYQMITEPNWSQYDMDPF